MGIGSTSTRRMASRRRASLTAMSCRSGRRASRVGGGEQEGASSQSARMRGARASGTARGSRGKANLNRAGQVSGRVESNCLVRAARSLRTSPRKGGRQRAGSPFVSKSRPASASSSLRTTCSRRATHPMMIRRRSRDSAARAATAAGSPIAATARAYEARALSQRACVGGGDVWTVFMRKS
jgi:hypothetical protein